MRWICGNGWSNSFKPAAPKRRRSGTLNWAAAPFTAIWPPSRPTLWPPKTNWGSWRKLDPAKLQAHVKKHPDATLAELQKVFAVSHHAVWTRLNQLGFTLKKLMKYRERNEVQRWLFRRELEKLVPANVYYLDECGVDHRLYREWGRAPRGERIYAAVAGKRRERTSLIAASQKSRLVAPLVFQGSCNTEVVDTYFEKVLLPVLPKGSVIVLDNARFHQSPTTAALVAAAGCELLFPPGLLARPQSHRTPLGQLQDPPPQRPPHRHQPFPFYR